MLEIVAEHNNDYHNAFKELYNRYSKRLYAYCIHQSSNREHSQNAFQEAWIALFENCLAQKKIINISAFLISTSRRRIIDYIRKEKRTPQFTELNEEISENYVNIENSDNTDLSNLLNEGLSKLNPDMREAFLMKRINNLEFKEMADITGLSVDCLKKRVYRAEDFLKDFLKNKIESH